VVRTGEPGARSCHGRALSGRRHLLRVPGLGASALSGAALAAQCLRRSDAARWTLWSVTFAAFMAEATLPLTWELRFGALLLLIGPIVFYAGSVFRAI
jgi:hypothetical protein